MAVSAADVRQVAELARLHVDDSVIPTLVAELNGILGHMEVLQQVTVAALDDEPPAGRMPLRDPATASVSLQRERELFAPDMREGFFLVPRLATHEGQGAAADA
jgi:aspartyl-tRNA(Asn)/glutamyl-tRNA(Gln) amidotransferase subunit C